MGPLHGIRVIDMTTVIMGPYATQILGDLGADIIKVEAPEGDTSRQTGSGRTRGMNGITLNLQRNKRSIVLDLKKPSGRDALLRLAKGADVLVHNLRRRAMERLGLGYESVRAVNPSIVYCAAYGFRHDGPYGDKAAYDDLIQGASGLAALMGHVGGTPAYVPSVIADKVTGLTMVYAILGALFHRERHSVGQEIEVPMFETMISFNLVEHIRGRAFEPPLGRVGYERLLSKFRKPFRTLDSYLSLLPYTDRQWQEFFRIAGRSDLAADARFATLASRTSHIDELYALLEQIVATRTTSEWVAVCDATSIPAMPVLDLNDLWDDPHLSATRFFEVATHPTEGDYCTIGMPVRFSATPSAITRHAPRVGQHNRDILREARYTDDEIDRMIATGVTTRGT
jgi:crotonobetainyl-CoA:carnitine CoA-transferase CaiB-like acyl-CoA transferase